MAEPVKFKQQNSTFTKPSSMTESECGDLPTWKGDGQIISKWKLTEEELKEVQRTGHIYLHVTGTVQPPVAISGIDPWAEISNQKG